jgi:hypothetical protein
MAITTNVNYQKSAKIACTALVTKYKYIVKYCKIGHLLQITWKLLLLSLIFILFLKSQYIFVKFDFLEIFWLIWRHAALKQILHISVLILASK